MQHIKRNVVALLIAGGSVVFGLAGVPALASSHAATPKSVTGPELIAGVVHGKKALANNTVIPLWFAGLVTTHSVVNLGGPGGPHKGSMKTLGTPKGDLTVQVTSKPHSSLIFRAKTCRFTFTEDIALTVVGSKSTGAFAHASGPGAVQVSFAETAPRYQSGPKKGQCNPKGQPIARTAVARFLGSLVLTVQS